MADGAAATAAPRAGVKGSSAGPWWKSLTGKKKHKEASAGPAPPAASETPPAAPPSPGGREEQPPPFGSGEAAGAGGGNRRSLRVSHSGRFKERRKVRTSLLADSPEVFDGGGARGHDAQASE
ncbi:PRR15 protein, partial [Cepphus grylle]|nr:PRR15 protein [Cepphus grylle]